MPAPLPRTSPPRTSPSAQDTDTAQSTAMFTVHGVGVVDGVAIGRAVVMGTTALEVPHYYITTAEIESEIARLKRAVATVQDDLGRRKEQLPAAAPGGLGPVLAVDG